jgi:glycosyltransferase involved in cell wall biosynthesis
MVQRIAVLICCFNRKAQTLACLARLCQQQVDTTFPFALSIYLLDNGNDGTLQAVTEQFPQVCTRKGQADWYWNTGMRQLWLPILDDNHDFVLWLNDDVQLDFDAVSRLLSCYHQEQFAYQNQLTRRASVGAIIGAMREPITHKQQPEPELSYGGRNRVSAWHPSAFGPLLPISSRNVDCDFINGNFCLIPKASVEKVGILSAEYTHGMGDYDYGHRLQQAGYRLVVAAGSYGVCASHPFASSIYNAAQPFQERLVKLKLPNVLPPVVEWRRYLRQHGGAIWPLLWFKTYIRQWFPWLWLWLRQSHKPMREQRLKKVLIVQPMFKQYRLEFFQHLNENLKQHGIELVFCYSEPIPAEALKADNLVNTGMSFTKLVPYKKIGPFFWQSLPDFANFELVIVEQANKYVQNWLLLARRCLGLKPILAYWGHGFNHQHRHGWKEWIKRKVVARADGFFAYTKPVADYVVSQGFPEKHTFILNNSIDTKEFAKLVDSRRLINPQKVKLVLIFCSALYHDKQIPLLLKTAKHLFDLGIIERLIVLGQGPLQDLCLEQANETWLDYRGACFAEQKAQAFAEADVMFHPGLVGLVILDAFAAGLPFVTTDFPGHSPEIAYLEPGKNGLQVPMTEQALVEAIIKLQQDRALLATLSAGALASSKLYTVEAMAESFANGVVELLAVREKK